jgi:hypothetical protein
MADHDGSIASKMEDWIVAAILAITDGDPAAAVFEESEVKPWDGSNAGTVAQFKTELMAASRNVIARVFFRGDQIQELQEGEIRPIGQFVVLVGVRNDRPAMSRRGDGTTIGTNRMRDLLRYALHDKQPLEDGGPAPLNDAVTAIDRVRFMGSELVLNDPGLCIQQTTLEIDESESAT